MDVETQKKKLLIVEDDEDSQKFLALFLKRSFELEMSNSAETFYEKIENNEFDLILMDVSLRGEKDGLQLTREIKQIDKYKDIPIVALTANAFSEHRNECIEVGMDNYISKPFQPKDIFSILKQYLHGKE